MESVRTFFSSRILLFDEAPAMRRGHLCAELGYTNPDLLIASIAWPRDYTAVTRNVRRFEPTRIPIINPSGSSEGLCPSQN